jgi:hypothetical protein
MRSSAPGSMRATGVSKKLNFGVSDLVRHRALYQRCLSIIIEIRPTGFVDEVAYVLWGVSASHGTFFRALPWCNLPRTVV